MKGVMDFKIAQDTLALIPEARPFVEKLSAQRIRHESGFNPRRVKCCFDAKTTGRIGFVINDLACPRKFQPIQSRKCEI